ncbi:hypothetical protein CY35_04G120500 [Sphagnum magellanicum]|nr:hypothetical protein CY35_04G120500 [Sphagnum magellanicum]
MEVDDVFIRLVEEARATLLLHQQQQLQLQQEKKRKQQQHQQEPSWAWVCMRLLSCCSAYPSGVTPAILLSDLFQDAQEKERLGNGWKTGDKNGGAAIRSSLTTVLDQQQKQQQLPRLPNMVTIDSIHEKKFVSLDSVLQVVILSVHLLPGTSSYVLTLGDTWSSSTIDLYLHRKFYDLIEPNNAILKTGREIRLAGCRLRSAPGLAQPRLLPTEFLVILLDEEQEDDAMLLGAKFCSDTFANIPLDLAESNLEFCFYARLDRKGEVTVEGQHNHVKHQVITLCDDTGDSLPLVLWDDQISISSLLSEGSMVALERPFIATGWDCGLQSGAPICLQYGSVTHLYTLPYVPREEQVTVGSSQSVNKWAKHRTEQLAGCGPREDENQSVFMSQVMLPRDSQGSVDFNNFPYRLLIGHLQPRMSHVALYAHVTWAVGAPAVKSNEEQKEHSNRTFFLRLQDPTGFVDVKLHFNERWSAGKVFVGHVIFLTGLTTIVGGDGRVEGQWLEKDTEAMLVNITQLPALLSSPSLHQILPLSSLSSTSSTSHVCRVRIGKLGPEDVQKMLELKWWHGVQDRQLLK